MAKGKVKKQSKNAKGEKKTVGIPEKRIKPKAEFILIEQTKNVVIENGCANGFPIVDICIRRFGKDYIKCKNEKLEV